MKTLLTAASAIAISTALPALAADVYVPVQEQFPEEYFEGNKAAGYVDLHYGFLWPYEGEGGGSGTDWRTAGIAGRGNLPFSKDSMFNLQLDGTADAVFASGKGTPFGTPIEATGHLYVRDPSRYAFGAFGSYGVAEGFDIWGGGLEGQVFIDRFTLYGQGGYRSGDNGTDTNVTEWYLRGIARYFPTDNIRLEGELGYAWYSVPGNIAPTALFWSATAEYRFDHMPLGVYAKYNGNYVSVEDNSGTSNALLLGVRAHLGSDSLFDNDRRGASFDTRIPEPSIYSGDAKKE